MKIYNGYAGLGGNIELIDDADHDITNVELEPEIAGVLQKRKPRQNVIIADAHQFLLDHADEFDFAWVSPPCQKHGRMVQATRHKKRSYIDMNLYQEIIFLKHFFNGLWVVENVKPYYDPLVPPTAIIGRHYFWANFKITPFQGPEQPKGFITAGTVAKTEKLKEWLGIHYEGNIYYKENHCPGQVLRNCVHPKLGLHIFNCALNHIEKQVSQNQLF